MGFALKLYNAAQKTLRLLDDEDRGRLVLSLFFKSILGIERIFHFETLEDPGFSILTGGRKTLSRTKLGGLLRKVSLESVEELMVNTREKLKKAKEITVSIDEHALARFTRKFAISKGYHTIRNKHMKIEKLCFVFDVAGRRLVSLLSTTGEKGLEEISKKLLPSLRRRAQGSVLRVILDAGAAKNHNSLLELVNHIRQVTIVRVPRRPGYLKKWSQIDESNWTRLEEPGPYKGAPPKVIHLTETRTELEGDRQADGSTYKASVRTIVVREERRQKELDEKNKDRSNGNKDSRDNNSPLLPETNDDKKNKGEHDKKDKDRWHALWVFRDETTPAYDIIEEYRTRQFHEQRYRILVHDLFVDTAPSGYDKQCADPDSPEFNGNALTLYGWIAAYASNILEKFSEYLPPRFHNAHPRTLKRWIFNIPGELYLGNETLIVILKPHRLEKIWPDLLHVINDRSIRLPWYSNRRLILSLSKDILRQIREENRKFQLKQSDT